MTTKTETVKLYRVENPNIPAKPNGVTSHDDLVGQWFTPNLASAARYLRKSTQTFGKGAHIVDGAQLVIAEVPANKLDELHVSRHPVAAGMDVEDDNYIVGRSDTSHTTVVLPLDESLGDLRGRLGQLEPRLEAARRLEALVQNIGEQAVSAANQQQTSH